jgi:N-acetylmuramoyl-L-alanine amidase
LNVLVSPLAFSENFAASSAKPNRITNVVENLRQGNVTLITGGNIPAPQTRYLGADVGLKLMVCDFAGVVWPYPARLIKFRPPNGWNSTAVPGRGISAGSVDSSPSSVPDSPVSSSIVFLNLGQFQSSPPIFRVTIGAKNAEALKNLSFQTSLHELIVKWTDPTTASRSNGSTVLATRPDFSRSWKSQRKLEQVSPDAIASLDGDRANAVSLSTAPSDNANLKLVFTSESLANETNQLEKNGHDNQVYEAQSGRQDEPRLAPKSLENQSLRTGSGVPMVQENNIFEDNKSTMEERSQLAPVPPPTVKFSNSEKTELEIASASKITFRSFRLREPERFVVDFDDMIGLAEVALPQVGDTPFLRSLRASSAQGKHRARLVCDLISDTTAAETILSDNGNKLTISFKREAKAPSRLALNGMKIVLDAGHGGSDPGAQRGVWQEKDLTLPITLYLKNRLEERGAQVILTRADDTYVSLEDRVRLTNRLAPDLFLSVHINSLDSDRDLQGIETYYQTPQSRILADCIHESLVNHLNVPDRAVRKARFYVINHTAVPAVLAEVGFISCKDEREKLISSEYQKRIARALEHGVMLYSSKVTELAHSENPSRKSLALSGPEPVSNTAEGSRVGQFARESLGSD